VFGLAANFDGVSAVYFGRFSIHPKNRFVGLIIKELLKTFFALFPFD
jgi:hypothetical protein